jgi:glutamate synthase (ferredoxin)
VLDTDNSFEQHCNKESLNLLRVQEDQDIAELKGLIENHYNATFSPLAQKILEQWDHYLPQFIKVLPEEYRKALIRLENEQIQMT